MNDQGEWITTPMSLRAFRRFQFGTVTALVAIGTFHYLYREYGDPSSLLKITRLFDVGREDTITTAFSTLNLFISAILLYLIHCLSKSRGEAKLATYWLILCIIFVFLSIDEAAAIHERTDRLNRFTGLEFPGLAFNKWVVYGGLFAGAVFLFFIPFLLALPRNTALMILLSGGIFISGALGMEFLGAMMLQTGFVSDRTDIIYAIRRLFEEGLELYGIALFNCTLFAYLVPSTIGINFKHTGQ